MSQETIDGKNSVVAQIYGIAGELTLEIEGQRKLLDLPCARIEDTQGTAKQPTAKSGRRFENNCANYSSPSCRPRNQLDSRECVAVERGQEILAVCDTNTLRLDLLTRLNQRPIAVADREGSKYIERFLVSSLVLYCYHVRLRAVLVLPNASSLVGEPYF